MITRIICLLIGYVCGLFQTGYLYGKKHNFDLRKHGSGNSGTTNTIRTMGWKAGGVVFVGDVVKCIVAVVVIYFLFRSNDMVDIKLLMLYGSAGAILGHDYPFYLKFKGGKGMACTAGLCLATPALLPFEFVVFAVPVLLTKYVSLGSILVSIGLPVFSYMTIRMGWLNISAAFVTEYIILMTCIGALNIFRHRANIKRLLTGTENKFMPSKKEE